MVSELAAATAALTAVEAEQVAATAALTAVDPGLTVERLYSANPGRLRFSRRRFHAPIDPQTRSLDVW